ncbi:hypothetical protein BDY21DRAFT_366910 [Lineolata rhizophorae]|uniref:Uncharacterized protein n=1 Tax=Lineolata rhizophorae TaxID=578093 RepID=A0A6A6NPJ3_9PEZI|nr:hypothetical protein BDY21DRAFT_366910 [Lineolata rhizophorae]
MQRRRAGGTGGCALQRAARKVGCTHPAPASRGDEITTEAQKRRAASTSPKQAQPRSANDIRKSWQRALAVSTPTAGCSRPIPRPGPYAVRIKIHARSAPATRLSLRQLASATTRSAGQSGAASVRAQRSRRPGACACPAFSADGRCGARGHPSVARRPRVMRHRRLPSSFLAGASSGLEPQRSTPSCHSFRARPSAIGLPHARRIYRAWVSHKTARRRKPGRPPMTTSHTLGS